MDIDIYVAEQKLKILSEKQNILKITTIWKGSYIFVMYNKILNDISIFGNDTNDTNDIENEDTQQIIEIIKKYIKKT